MSTISSFKGIRNKHDEDKRKDCMKIICLKKYTRRKIYLKKNKMKLLTNEKQGSYEKAKSAIFVKKKLENIG